MILIVTEKPSVAKDFANALGCSFKDGYYSSNEYIVTNCIGHLYELCEPSCYNEKFSQWNFGDLPIIPERLEYTVKKEVVKQEKLVRQLLEKNKSNTIIIATDAGREGELIGRLALEHAKITNHIHVKRFWVSEALQKNVILTGLQKAKPLAEYDVLSREGYARQHADWLIGINISRLVSIKSGKTFGIGRVKAAVVNAVYKRNEEIKNFVSKDFYELSVMVVSEKTGENVKTKLFINKTTFDSHNELKEVLPKFTYKQPVTLLESKKEVKTVSPPQLYNLTALQREAYKKYGYLPDKVLDIAQSLYEKHKVLSYPRTPSRVMGESDVELIAAKFHLLKNTYSTGTANEANIRTNNKNVFNNAKLEDHHALIPLSIPEQTLSAEENNIFDMVVARFFTCLSDNYVYELYKLTFESAGYVLNGNVQYVIQKGWKQKKDDDDEELSLLKDINAFCNNPLCIGNAEIESKKTSPKKQFTIDTLLGFMEKPFDDESKKLARLGTPATSAEIIKEVLKREYLCIDKKALYVTETGIFLLTQLLSNEKLAVIADVKQTTDWEEQLSVNPEEFIESIKKYVNEVCKSDINIGTFRNEQKQRTSIETCPLCQKGEVREGEKSYYCSEYKNGCNFTIWKKTFGTSITHSDVKKMIHGDIITKKCISKAGKAYEGKLVFQDGKVVLQFENQKA